MNSQKRKKNIIISCRQTSSFGRGLILAAVFLGISFSVTTVRADDSLPLQSQGKPSSSNGKLSSKKARPSSPQSTARRAVKSSYTSSPKKPAAGEAVKSSSASSPKKPAADEAVKSSSSLSLLPKISSLQQNANSITTADATSTTAQGKVEQQKILIGKETQTLSTDTSKKTILKTKLLENQTAINQDTATVATDKTELNAGDKLLEAAKNEATSAEAAVTTLKAKKQDLTQSITVSQNNLEKTQNEISTLQSQISATKSELHSGSPAGIKTTQNKISQLTKQLQAKQNEVKTLQTSLSTLKNKTAAEIKQNLAAAQQKQNLAAQKLQTINTALTHDQSALQAAKKALNTEDSKLKVVQNLAASYAAQAALAKTNLQTATAQEKALVAQTGTNTKSLTALQKDEATLVTIKPEIAQDEAYQSDYDTLVTNNTPMWYNQNQAETPAQAAYYHDGGVNWDPQEYGVYVASENQLGAASSLHQTIQNLKSQTQAFSQNLQTDQKAVQTAQASYTQDANLSAAEQKTLQTDTPLFVQLQQKYKSTIAADTSLIVKNSQTASTAQQALTAAEEDVTNWTLIKDTVAPNAVQNLAHTYAAQAAQATTNLQTAQAQENTLLSQTGTNTKSLTALQQDESTLATIKPEIAQDEAYQSDYDTLVNNNTPMWYNQNQAETPAQAAYYHNGGVNWDPQEYGVFVASENQLNTASSLDQNIQNLKSQTQAFSQNLQTDQKAVQTAQASYTQDANRSAAEQGILNEDNLQQSINSDKSSMTSLTNTVAQDKNSLKNLTSENTNKLNTTLSSDQTALHQDQSVAQAQKTTLLLQNNALTQLNTKINQASLSLQDSKTNVQTQLLKVSDATTALQKAAQDLTTAEQTESTTSDDLSALTSQVTTLQTTLSQNQDLLDQLQTQASHDENNVTLLQTQQKNLKKEIQTQISQYNSLVIQANALKEEWNQAGSLSVLNNYNVIVQKIKSVNEQLQTLGGYTLSNLSPLVYHQSSSVPPVDTITPLNNEESITEEVFPQENEGENAQERDAQGDERDDTLMEKQQDMSGGFMPVPGLAGFVGAQAVTGNKTN